MIAIKRDGSVVVVVISARVEGLGERMFTFNNGWGREVSAALVAEKLQDTLREAIESCRRAEYERGWKDAKSKRATKRTWFRPFISGDAP